MIAVFAIGMVASLALFWFTQDRTIRIDTMRHRFTVMRFGYSICSWADLRSKIDEPAIAESKESDYWPLTKKRSLHQPEWTSPIKGIVRAGGSGTKRDMMSFYIGVRHWLVISFWTAVITLVLSAKAGTTAVVNAAKRFWHSLED